MGKHLLFAAIVSAMAAGCLHAQPGHVEGGVLGRVVIYRNGVAFYERRAQVVNGTLTVQVPRERVDDFLKSLTVVDPATRKPLAVTIPRQQDESGSFLTMTLATEEKKRAEVLLTYVTEAPAWKPSYRVVLGTAGKVELEGWAIVDNTTTEDWKHVLIGVGASSALAFRYDLWSVRKIDRDLLEGEDRVAIAPPSGVSPYSTAGAQELGTLDATEVRTVAADGGGTAASAHVAGGVVDQQTGEHLAGVTVVATAPTLATAQTAITDSTGAYSLALPPGTYTVAFYYNDLTVEHSGIVARANQTTPVFQKLTPSSRAGETISSRASTIDSTSTAQGRGASFSGSVSLENQYSVDGVATTGVSFGGSSNAQQPPPPVRTGDAKLQAIASTVLATGQSVIVEVSGPASAAQEAASRGSAVKAALIDDGVPAARIRVVAKATEGGLASVRVLAIAPSAAPEARDLGPDTPVGESHFFADRPMTVNAGTSAMISMVHGETTGGVAYLYDPVSDRGDVRYAFKSVRLDNPTGDTLEPGPVTVYGDGRFIGEGITEPVPPHAAVVVPFALDKQIVVARAATEEDRIAKLVAVERGVITAEIQHRRATTFTLTSRLGEASTVYVRHRLESGWSLVDPPSTPMTVGDSQLFAVTLAGGATTTLTITEATPLERTLPLASSEALAMMKVYIEAADVAPALTTQIKALLATHHKLGDLDDRMATLRDQLAEYHQRSAELTIQIVALRNVKQGNVLLAALRAKLGEISTLTQAATLQLVEAQNAQMLGRIELQNQLADLRLPDATRQASR